MKQTNRIDIQNTLVVIRGAGDLATGVAVRLHNCGFPIIMLEIPQPTVIRTTVAFATALFTGQTTVCGVKAVKTSKEDALATAELGVVAVVADPEGELIQTLKPRIVVDAILAKRNLGTNHSMADFTVALGPGFNAPEDVDVVVETKRGHTLGSLIWTGTAIANTGIPGIIGGYGKERVMHSPCAGIFKSACPIGTIVKAGDTVAWVGDTPVVTTIGGKVRGMLTDGLYVPEHFKVADVDPRGESTDHTTCSDKAFSIAGGVLEAIMHYLVLGK